jgi:rhamnosyltransferase
MDDVSIVIRCKNEEAYISRTLETIFSQKCAWPFEVVVVDSGSTDGTVDVARKFDAKIFSIPPEDFTFGYALNYGIERASGAIIINLSAHCVPVNNQWMQELVMPIAEGKADATFGRQAPIIGVNPFEEVSLIKHFPESGAGTGQRVPFSNANCAYRRVIWSETKFDEELSSWEDYLWHLQTKDRYSFVYCPKAGVYHSHPYSLRQITRRAYIDGKAFKTIKNKYDIDLLGGVCPTFKTKVRMFLEDVRHHARLFRQAGYGRHIFMLPVMRFLAYASYWRGYNSIE